ncbi:DUF1934 domain-containing protein [Streptococcus phocae]|uniref:50S ribosomal protein L19 n=1 Tax=Streptococcus phocae TaxID=119224 RepID=A0A0P6SK04_9STRE|nr:DUF1934 domain-containing protein [Streptococcus phocae]KPJ22639.1 50S ribosomal protein L19 [Streptococcus phocae]
MKITINNRIRFGEDTELISETHDCNMKQKGDFVYLMYQNGDAEKVVIKFNHTEMTMSRFSNPQSIMKFFAGKKALIALPTPMGIQQFLTDTQFYSYQEKQQTLELCYALLQANTEAVFATYELKITWS